MLAQSIPDTYMSSMSFETSTALLFIDGHAQRSDILAMYKNGPGDKGFMWSTSSDFPGAQGNAFNIMKHFVLDAGYDSSAYATMHLAIQKALKDRAAPLSPIRNRINHFQYYLRL